MEAQRREAKEAAEREANEASSQAAVQKEALGLQTKAKTKESEFEKPINSASAGDITKAAEAALKLERERLKKLEDLDEGNKALGLNVNKEVSTGVKKLLRESSGQYIDFSILSSLNSQVNHVTYYLFSRIYIYLIRANNFINATWMTIAATLISSNFPVLSDTILCVDVTGAYSALKTELNISLTAIGLLWTTTGFIAKRITHGPVEERETGI
ncbi:uncharacterized protein LOC133805865 [Humulus lupulus]|uniref:uncharacterized protein LOC133805865 n=1 Tax=Humulus lupulus TaxID=3486 RepID=UPI002B40FBB1|nr:uncharacterized protein LOC133805865 [Humulus lupulus]